MERLKTFSPRIKDHEYDISHYKDKFFILTNMDAKNKRLMVTDQNNTEISNWREVIKHDNEIHLLSMRIFQNHIVINDRKDGLRGFRILDQKYGNDHRITFDENTYSARFSVNEEFKTNILRFSYSSLKTPRSVYDYNMDSRKEY